MVKISLRKYVRKSDGGSKQIYCTKTWGNIIPPLTDPDVLNFVINLGDGRYEFVDSYRNLVDSFKVNSRGYRAHITPSGNIYKPKTKKGKDLIHCRHCFNIGAKETDYQKAYNDGYEAGHEVGFREGYDKCVDDTDEALTEAEGDEEEEEYEDEEVEEYEDEEVEEYEDEEEEEYEDDEEDEEYRDEDEDEDEDEEYGDEDKDENIDTED